MKNSISFYSMVLMSLLAVSNCCALRITNASGLSLPEHAATVTELSIESYSLDEPHRTTPIFTTSERLPFGKFADLPIHLEKDTPLIINVTLLGRTEEHDNFMSFRLAKGLLEDDEILIMTKENGHAYIYPIERITS